ncbi:MAG TPA: dipeptidase [Steroidobacteraceae bacterium]|nr:dipeptidase [Steroidobacteraceae bacterium]
MRLLHRCIAALAVLPALGLAAPKPIDDATRIARILTAAPLIDGHNDLPWEIRDRFHSVLSKVDLHANTAALPAPADAPALMTDIPRLRQGHVGGQFWSVWIPAEIRGPQAIQMTLEQIDLVHRMVERYPQDLEFAYTAGDVRRIHRAGRIASLIGIEGGNQINNSLPALRQMYAAGARYLTLTHTLNTDWADSATDNPRHHGLTPFGREVVREMNRLGMLIDLSHVSPETMRAALEVTAAPVIFSHSSARALVDHPRDVPDDILQLVARNGGVVMVNFNPGYISAPRARWEADYAAEVARFNSPPYAGLYVGQPERAKAALDLWKGSHPAPEATVADVADHIEHIRAVAGVDHVGLGSDFDGVEATPKGLDGVDKFPAIFAELVHRGWSDADLEKLAGNNVLRVLQTAETVSARLRTERPPSEATIETLDPSH